MNYIALGKEIRDLRRKRGLTQEQLAELADLSTPYVSHLERGTKNPSLAVLVRLADCLQVTVDRLQRQSGVGQRRILSRGPRNSGRLLHQRTSSSNRNRQRGQAKYPGAQVNPSAIDIKMESAGIKMFLK